MNVIIYAEYRNSSAEVIGVIPENLYDEIYPRVRKWAMSMGYDRITEAVLEDDQGIDFAINELKKLKGDV